MGTLVASAPLDNVGAIADRGTAHVFVRTGTTWTHQAQLIVSDGAAFDNLGGYVSGASISGDTIVLGAKVDQVGPNAQQGSAYVFTRSGGVWDEQAKLDAFDGSAGDNFGESVSIAGDTVAVGVPADDIGTATDRGSVRVYSRVGGVWSEVAQLNPPSASSFIRFGATVSLVADALLVGATGASPGNAGPLGAAYMFARSPGGSIWTNRTTLFAPNGLAGNFGEAVALDGSRAIVSGRVPPDIAIGAAWIFDVAQGQSTGVPEIIVANPADAGSGDRFGSPISIHGNVLVVGSLGDDIGANVNQGSAYVYERAAPDQPWVQVAKLLAFDGGANHEFGNSVIAQDDTIIVGARQENAQRGAAYVFRKDQSGSWVNTQKLTCAALDTRNPNDYFGHDMAIDGNTLAISAFSDDVGGGAVYVFVRGSSGSWNASAKLQAFDEEVDNLGYSIGLRGDTIVAGAPLSDRGVVDRGAVVVFTRSNGVWTQRVRITPPETTGGAYFGESVDLSGDTLVVGAYAQVNGGIRPGATYVFTGSGATWTQQARLDPPDGGDNDQFGFGLVLRGDLLAVSSVTANVENLVDAGATYIYGRIGSSWTLRQKVTAFDKATGDQFGFFPTLDGTTLYAGALFRQVGSNFQQGSLYRVPVCPDALPFVRNLTINTSHASLAEAVTTAASGHQIAATSSAWGNMTSLDTLGRSIGFSSTGWLATPPSSIITLGGASYLASGTDQPVEIFGQLRVSSNSSADVSGSGFLLGSRGTLTARTGSSLSISTPSASLLGTTRLEPGAAFTLAGSASNSGVLTAAVNASIVANGPLSSSGSFTLTAGTITTPAFTNTGQASIFGSSAIFGSFTNAAGATTTIRSGSLFVFGSLTNNGAIVGSICASCLGTPPNMDVDGDLTIGSVGSLLMPFADSVVRVGGSFDCAINDSARFDLGLASLVFEGQTPVHELEVMSRDIGSDPDGLTAAPGRFPIGTIRVGPTPGVIRLVDRRDNDNLGQGTPESIYVRSLRIDAGSRLDNTAGKVYYDTLINNGTVDVPANLIQLPQPCAADFDQSGVLDFVDIFSFLNAWFAANPVADFNQSGELEIGDIFTFLNAWFAGCS
ncbi:MAG: FG-GAP repeat protein [Phycisphaerales bacterium]|nr:FG-GAP repeat protein [Phycisphaerales bacterium]